MSDSTDSLHMLPTYGIAQDGAPVMWTTHAVALSRPLTMSDIEASAWRIEEGVLRQFGGPWDPEMIVAHPESSLHPRNWPAIDTEDPISLLFSRDRLSNAQWRQIGG